MRQKTIHLVRYRWYTAVAVPLAFVLLPLVANAQYGRFFVDGTGGVAIPAAGLSKYADPGVAAGMQVGYQLTNRFAVRLNGDFQHLNGGTIVGQLTPAPNLDLWSYTAGLQANLFPMLANGRENRWQLLADVGLGATTFNSGSFVWLSDPNTRREFNHTYFATQGGLKLAYVPAKRLSLYVTGRAYHTFVDEDDTATLANISPGSLSTFESAVTFPVTAGLRVRI